MSKSNIERMQVRAIATTRGKGEDLRDMPEFLYPSHFTAKPLHDAVKKALLENKESKNSVKLD